MPLIDQFESVFRAATREAFTHRPIEFSRVLLVTDDRSDLPGNLRQRLEDGLAGAPAFTKSVWSDLVLHRDRGVGELLEAIEAANPDLICTTRRLGSLGSEHAFGLSEYLLTLTQATEYPVLVIPAVTSSDSAPPLENTDVVMAMTDHLAGDHRLVNYAAAVAAPAGSLILAHVEDGTTFDRYMATIAKIPTIDTEGARAQIIEQLLADARNYSSTCRAALAEVRPKLTVVEAIEVGHRLAEYHRLVEKHAVDVLVLNTKDDDQVAMHGLAYPVAVELRAVPLLML